MWEEFKMSNTSWVENRQVAYILSYAYVYDADTTIGLPEEHEHVLRWNSI